jgi:hypothetical protein
VHAGDDAALVALAGELRQLHILREVAPRHGYRVEVKVAPDVPVLEPAVAQQRRRHERPARCDRDLCLDPQLLGDSAITRARGQQTNALLAPAVLARFAFALEYEPLGLAPSQDDRTARDSVGEPRRVRPAFVACGAPEVAVPAEVAFRRVARHGVGTQPERLAPAPDHLVLEPLLPARVGHREPGTNRVHGPRVRRAREHREPVLARPLPRDLLRCADAGGPVHRRPAAHRRAREQDGCHVGCAEDAGDPWTGPPRSCSPRP